MDGILQRMEMIGKSSAIKVNVNVEHLFLLIDLCFISTVQEVSSYEREDYPAFPRSDKTGLPIPWFGEIVRCRLISSIWRKLLVLLYWKLAGTPSFLLPANMI